MDALIVNIIGWIAMILIVVAYWLIVINKIKTNSLTYNLLNLIGGIGIIVNASYFSAWPSAVLNVFWVVIAIYAISKINRGKKK